MDSYVTLDELADHGLAPADVRVRCPWATEYTALDGRSCWMRADLDALLGDGEGAMP